MTRYTIDYGEGTALFYTPYPDVEKRFKTLAKVDTVIQDRITQFKIVLIEEVVKGSHDEWNEKLALNFDVYYWREDGARMKFNYFMPAGRYAIENDKEWDESFCDICRYRPEGELTINGYQEEALRTVNYELTKEQQLMNGIMGLNGEAGECIDILKKHLFQGHPMDEEHLAKELGDVAWYLAVTASVLGYKLEDIFRMNIEKLTKRYPGKFNVAHSINRAEGDI